MEISVSIYDREDKLNFIVEKINNIEKDRNPTYLGMQLDHELTLKNHVDNLKIKANRKLKLLQKS